MAASTINREAWTDDDGSNTTGTVLNNDRLQNDVYAAIDEMFAGAGGFATFTFGGKIAAEGVGTHSISGGGAGGNVWLVRNTTAGSANLAAVQLGNDAAASVGKLSALSSTYTPATIYSADGVTLEASRAGGLDIAATHASGAIKFYPGGTAESARFIPQGGLRLTERSTDPVAGDVPSLAGCILYMKNDKFCIAYNSGGTMQFARLTLDGSAITWVHNTTAP